MREFRLYAEIFDKFLNGTIETGKNRADLEEKNIVNFPDVNSVK
jgi:hypothetical protein